jgi:fatty-acyl-CoA synthase
MHNCPQFIVAYYAILRAGGMVVPLNSLIVTNELRYYLQDSQTRIAFTSQDLYPQIAPLLREGVLDRLILAAYSEYSGEPGEVPVPEVVKEPRHAIADEGVTLWSEALGAAVYPGPLSTTADDLAVMVYTSGTTGEPKGCLHTHRTAMANVVGGAVWTQGTMQSVVLATLPLFHVTGMQGSMNAPIYLGAGIVLMTRWDRDAAAALSRYGCYRLGQHSTMMIDFQIRIAEYDLHTLEGIGGGGGFPRGRRRAAPRDVGLTTLEGYGLSELWPDSCQSTDRQAAVSGIPF